MMLHFQSLHCYVCSYVTSANQGVGVPGFQMGEWGCCFLSRTSSSTMCLRSHIHVLSLLMKFGARGALGVEWVPNVKRTRYAKAAGECLKFSDGQLLLGQKESGGGGGSNRHSDL